MQKEQNASFNYLVVDDSEFARKTLVKILDSVGGTLAGEAASGQEAIQKYRALKPDIVFMDITMPGMEGMDALEMILRDDTAARVIMVSSLSHYALVKDALKRGAKHFITKPVQQAPMAEIVKFVLSC